MRLFCVKCKVFFWGGILTYPQKVGAFGRMGPKTTDIKWLYSNGFCHTNNDMNDHQGRRINYIVHICTYHIILYHIILYYIATSRHGFCLYLYPICLNCGGLPPVPRHLNQFHSVLRLDSALRRERDEIAMRHDELMHELHTLLGVSSWSIRCSLAGVIQE